MKPLIILFKLIALLLAGQSVFAQESKELTSCKDQGDNEFESLSDLARCLRGNDTVLIRDGDGLTGISINDLIEQGIIEIDLPSVDAATSPVTLTLNSDATSAPVTMTLNADASSSPVTITIVANDASTSPVTICIVNSESRNIEVEGISETEIIEHLSKAGLSSKEIEALLKAVADKLEAFAVPVNENEFLYFRK